MDVSYLIIYTLTLLLIADLLDDTIQWIQLDK